MSSVAVSQPQIQPLHRAIPAAAGKHWRDQFFSVLCHSHTYSGRADHGGTVRPPESYRRLAAWARRHGVNAVGVGSPYTPAASALYSRFDADERDVYYDPAFDKRSVLELEQREIETMLEDLNEFGDDRLLFYLDNETPKGRYGHLWWFGHVPDFPAWHDYDQPYDRWMLEDTAAKTDSNEPVPYERRPYMQIVASQRQMGALGFWAHPTSWWTGHDGRFITNIATEMPARAVADGYLDGMVVMGYSPERPEYQAVWFALLDMGYRVPGVAEVDMGLSEEAIDSRHPLLNYAPIGAGGVRQSVRDAMATGRTFSSSGPMVDLRVDSARPGDVVRSSADTVHDVTITAHPAKPDERLDHVELVGRGGRVLWRGGFVDGSIHAKIHGSDEVGYFIVRAMGAMDRYQDKPNRRPRYAISNPVYLHPAGRTFAKPAKTSLRLRFGDRSQWLGAALRFESATGEVLATTTVKAGEIQEIMPAAGRWTLQHDGGPARTEYLINANQRLLDLQRYLYRGRFLRDFPRAKSGEVPIEAWRLGEHRDAMRELIVER